MDGRPLQELVEGRTEDWPQEVFLQISESHVARAIRTKKWKYCMYDPNKNPWKDSCSDVYMKQYLYDLETDPYEKNNLVGNKEYREISEQLAEILKRKMVEAGEKGPVIISGQI